MARCSEEGGNVAPGVLGAAQRFMFGWYEDEAGNLGSATHPLCVVFKGMGRGEGIVAGKLPLTKAGRRWQPLPGRLVGTVDHVYVARTAKCCGYFEYGLVVFWFYFFVFPPFLLV